MSKLRAVYGLLLVLCAASCGTTDAPSTQAGNAGGGGDGGADFGRAGSDNTPGDAGAPNGDALADAECRAHAAQVLVLFKERCSQCHDGPTGNAGGLDDILNADKLRTRKSKAGGPIVDAGKPDNSLLYQRLEKKQMPAVGKLFDPAELSQVESWITCGAPALVPFTDTSPLGEDAREFLGYDHVYKHIAADLRTGGSEATLFRYISLTHLRDAGVSDEQLDAYGQAVIFVLNSVSWSPTLIAPHFVDDEKTVIRFSLSGLLRNKVEASDAFWNRVLRQYPYGLKYDHRDAAFIAATVHSDIPFVRGDWFVEHAATPPLYETLLELPGTAGALEKQLGVDVNANIAASKVARAGFQASGVSVSNRVVERHKTDFGAYWKSYDFRNDAERRNIFRFPLGPGSSGSAFAHDGGEIIFNLPNGLQAYLLVNAGGARLDKAPADIVQDNSRPDSAVVNGLSCMGCHTDGMIPKDDEVRAFVDANDGTFDATTIAKVHALYPPHAAFSALQSSDTKRFQAALSAISVTPLARDDHPVRQIVKNYEFALDLGRVAAELGIRAETLRASLEGHANVQRALGTVATGGTIRREAFEELYRELVCTLGRGIFIAPTSVVTNPNGCGSAVEPKDLRAAADEAYCDWFSRCTVGRAPSTSSCSPLSLPEDIAVAVETGEATSDPKQLSRCLEDLRSASCDQSLLEDPLLLPSCRSALLPTKPAGGHCVSDVSCSPGTVCLPQVVTYPNPSAAQAEICGATCQPRSAFCTHDNHCGVDRMCVQGLCQNKPRLASAGEPCISIGAPDSFLRQCETVLTCLGNTCTPLAAVGGACEGPWNCQLGLTCELPDPNDPNILGTCVVPPFPSALGKACTATSGCSDPNAFCDPVSGKCVALPSSGPCMSGQFFALHRCNVDTAFCDSSNTCQPAKAEGENCSPPPANPFLQTGNCRVGLECREGLEGPFRCYKPFRCEAD